MPAHLAREPTQPHILPRVWDEHGRRVVRGREGPNPLKRMTPSGKSYLLRARALALVHHHGVRLERTTVGLQAHEASVDVPTLPVAEVQTRPWAGALGEFGPLDLRAHVEPEARPKLAAKLDDLLEQRHPSTVGYTHDPHRVRC